MSDKLQELTDKLYNEGLSKGKQDAEAMVAKAQAEAADIVAKAKAEAEHIVAQANREADELRTKVMADVKMAATQSIAVTRQEMEKMIVSTAAANGAACLSEGDFVKEMVKSIVAAFNPQNAAPVDLNLILPENLKSQVEPFVQNEVKNLFKADVNVSYDKKLGGGFKVAPKDGGYMLQFTDDEFRTLIANYLRPATKKILFG